MKQRSSIFAGACLLIALFLTACGSSSTGSGSTASGSTSATPTSTSSVTQANVTLAHVPTGTAVLNWDPSNKTLTVKVTMTGLAPNSTHPEHIHTGSCTNQGGVLHSLAILRADAYGNATATTTVPNVTSGIPASGWYVNIHNGPGLSTPEEALPIACGNVTNTNTSTSTTQSVQVTLNSPPTSPGQSATGTAQLTLSGSTLTVKLTVSGLVPASAHAAHIHLGSCSMQGKVIYPLTTLTADASGTATGTTTIHGVTSIPASGWYVNVHNSTNLTTQTGFDPIACGDVTIG